MPEIHARALVSDDARLAPGVTVGPFSIIDGPVVIGAGSTVGPHVSIRGRVVMGTGNTIGPGAVLGEDPQSIPFDPDTDSGIVLGDNNILREYVLIHRSIHPGENTTIGSDNFLMTNAHIAHDFLCGDHNIIGSNALFAGHVEVGNHAFIGGGAGFHQFMRIGDYAMVAGNATITMDVPPFCTTRRSNRLAGLNAIGLRRAGFTPEERKNIKAAYTLLFLSTLPRDQVFAEADSRDWNPHARQLIEAVRTPTKRGVLARHAGKVEH